MRTMRSWMVGALLVSTSAMQAAGQYSVALPNKQVSVSTVNGTAVFSGAYTSGLGGQPALPSYVVSFLLPPDADLASVSASVLTPKVQELGGTFAVAPIPPLRNNDGTLLWPKGSVIIDGKDTGIYRKNSFYPADFLGAVSTENPRQYKIAEIRINPYLYNPVSKKLRMITGGTLTVTFSEMPGQPASNVPRSFRLEKNLGSKIVNPAEFNEYGAMPAPETMLNPAAPSGGAKSSVTAQSAPLAVNAAAAASSLVSGCGYCIITNSYILNTCYTLRSYLRYLSEQGASLQVCDENWYNPNYGLPPQQSALNIREVIKNWYNSSFNPMYLLLIGCPDTAYNDVPMINCKGIPTDFGYANLNDTWKTEYTPTLYAGRIPVYYYSGQDNDVINGRLDRYLSRVLSYETSTDVEWRRYLMTASSPLGRVSSESYQFCENLVSQMRPFGWSYNRLYDPYSSMSDYHLVTELANMNPLPEHIYAGGPKVVATWNSETPGLFVWYTHGGPGVAHGILTSDQAASLNDLYPAMVFSASCCTSDPQYSTNLGVSTLWGNAISYIGATIPVYSPDIPAMLFSQYVGTRNCDAGLSLYITKAYDANVERSQAFNLYGCPEVSLNLDQAIGVPIPQNFVVSPAAAGSPIKLTWSGVSGATGYGIERSDNSTGPAKRVGFSRIATVGSNVTTYSDNGYGSNYKLYKYRIYAYNNTNWSGYSNLDSAATYSGTNGAVPAVPTGLTILTGGSNSATLKWTASANATSYNVKRSTKTTGPFITIANSAATTFYDNNLVTNATYYYTVSAVNQFGQSGNSGGNGYMVTATPKIPGNFVLAPFGDPRQVAMAWSSTTANANDLIFEFECARVFPDGSYGDFSVPFILRNADRQTTPRGFTWISTDTSLELNTKYAFKMRSGSICRPTNGTPQIAKYSDYTAVINYTTPAVESVPAPTGFSATTGIEKVLLNWTYAGPTENVSFEIFYTQNGVPWPNSYNPLTAPITANTLTIGAYRSTTYKVCMRAVKKVGGFKYCSNFTNLITVTVGPTLAAPTALTNFRQCQMRSQIYLGWQDNSNSETGHSVWRSTTLNGTYTKIGTNGVNMAWYYDNNLGDNVTYYYKVQAYYTNGGTTVTSAFSNTISATSAASLAIGKPASALSSQPANPAKNGNDNNTTTRWCANGAITGKENASSLPYWQVDLGKNMSVVGTEIMWERAQNYKYFIECLSDGGTTWYTTTDSTNAKSAKQTHRADYLYMTARYYRIKVIGPVGVWPSFFEFRVFGW